MLRFTFRVYPQERKRAADGAAAAGKAAPAAKKAKPTPANKAVAGADDEDAAGGITVDGLGTLTETEISGWAETGQVSTFFLSF